MNYRNTFPTPFLAKTGGVTFLTLDYATYVLAFFFDFLSYDFNNWMGTIVN